MNGLNETSRLQKAEKTFKGQTFVRTLGIISPANPMAKMTSKEENQHLVQKFKDYLKRTGDYFTAIGRDFKFSIPFSKFMESVEVHDALIEDCAFKSDVYAKLVESKLVESKLGKILDESYTPLSRRMECAFVYGSDWNNQFEEIIEDLMK